MVVINLAPSEIRYSQDSISNSFGDSTHHAGQYIGETLDEIVRDPDTANLIPNISVFKIGGKWFTLDNRRLWVFKKAEELDILSYIDVYDYIILNSQQLVMGNMFSYVGITLVDIYGSLCEER
jgi:hypothetical protein